MNKEKREKLESKGWKSTSVAEFLGLTPDEEKMVELRLAMNYLYRRFFISRFFIPIFVVAVLSVAAETAAGCSCGIIGTVDKVFDKSEVVAVFKLVSVIERDQRADDNEAEPGYVKVRHVTFSVEKVYKGDLKPGDQVTEVRKARGMCERGFSGKDEGRAFVFYLSSNPVKDKEWQIPFCSRAADMENAAADILWLDKAADVRGKTRLAGSLVRYWGAALADEGPRWEKMAGSPLTITGNGKTINIKTDENGVYEVYDLAPGKYRVMPVKIPGYTTNKEGYEEVEVRAGEMTEWGYTYSIDNAIRGRVLDSKGRTMNDVSVELVPARGKRTDDLFQSTDTEKGGRFELTSVPAGTYLILVNGGGKITAASPFGKFYYPGTANRAEASPINIGPGEFLNNLVITAPKTAETVTLSGVVVDEDGRPVPKALVEFVVDDSGGDEPEIDDDEDRTVDGFIRMRGNPNERPMVTADAAGRFSIKVLKGAAGELASWDIVMPGERGNCPKFDERIKKMIDDQNKESSQRGTVSISTTVRTEAIKITSAVNQAAIELRYPYSFCGGRENKREPPFRPGTPNI